ncbi:MAG: hypothetical protein PHH47_01685 [Gallionella sp.]|nr:hypothetical protein [Gallionella sp.]MDD4946754.1 hypothetical protein [Gallionella sp.]
MFRKILVTLLVLPGFVFLVKAGVADFLRLAPCSYIESIQHGARIYPTELFAAREQLLSARQWDASNPIVPEFLAQIALIRYRLVSFSPKLQEMFLNEAIDELQRAIELRPNLPHLWAARMTAASWLIASNARGVVDEALVKRELAAISIALHQAYVLAPSEPMVLQQIAVVGRLHYSELSVEDRDVIDGAVEQAGKLNLKI